MNAVRPLLILIITLTGVTGWSQDVGNTAPQPQPLPQQQRDIERRQIPLGNIKTLKERLEDPQVAEEDKHRFEKEIARSYIAIGDFANAIKHLESSIKLQDPADEREYYAVAQLYLETNDIKGAFNIAKDGVAVYPESIDLAQVVAHGHRFNEDWDKAIEQYEKMEKINEAGSNRPFSDSFYFFYGVSVERGLDDVERAKKLFEKSIDRIQVRDPRDRASVLRARQFKAKVLNYLGYMQLDKDMNIDEAGELIEQASVLDPESSAIADSLGWFYFKKGRYMDAMIELLKAESWMEENAENGVILDHIAQTFYKMGNVDRAITYLEKAVKWAPDNKEFKARLKEYSQK